MCKKTRAGPTQTRKKVLPPTREHSFSKITKPENQQKCTRNGTKGEPWMRAKRTLRVPWLTGFITLWPCAPKRRKNAPNCVRSVQVSAVGPEKTKNKPSTKMCPKVKKCWQIGGVWAFLRNTKKHKEKSPPKTGGHPPLRITFENLEKQAECAFSN